MTHDDLKKDVADYEVHLEEARQALREAVSWNEECQDRLWKARIALREFEVKNGL